MWDPCVQQRNLGYQMVNAPLEVLSLLDAMVFTVKHDQFAQLNNALKIEDMIGKMRTRVVVDGWGLFQRLAEKKGIQYLGIGLPNKRKRR